MKIYRGVLLKESLNDDSVLERLEIINTRQVEQSAPTNEQPRTWTWCSISIPETQLIETAEALAAALKPRAWYTNLWANGDYLLIFPGKIFRADNMDDKVWEEAIHHGLSLGIPYAQLTPLDDVLCAK